MSGKRPAVLPGIDKPVRGRYIITMEHGLFSESTPGLQPGGMPLHALQGTGDSTATETLARDKTGEEPEEPRSLVCKTCGTAITSRECAIEVSGSHRHTFMNPGGIVFRIGCFSGASGCYIMGEPTGDYTWFPGYAWCYVICSGCFSHLGWHYSSGEGGFFGLILDRLVMR